MIFLNKKQLRGIAGRKNFLWPKFPYLRYLAGIPVLDDLLGSSISPSRAVIMRARKRGLELIIPVGIKKEGFRAIISGGVKNYFMAFPYSNILSIEFETLEDIKEKQQDSILLNYLMQGLIIGSPFFSAKKVLDKLKHGNKEEPFSDSILSYLMLLNVTNPEGGNNIIVFSCIEYKKNRLENFYNLYIKDYIADIEQ